MAEENYPVVADEFVEVDRAICGISLEIGSNGSKAQSGGALLANSMRFQWGQRIDAGAAYGSGRCSSEPMFDFWNFAVCTWYLILYDNQ